MSYEILHKPDFSILKVHFDSPGDSILAEAGAMVARDSGVEMKTQMRGGLLKSAARSMLGGESFFMNTFSATQPGQNLYLAAGSEGDMVQLQLSAEKEFMVQSGNYLASAPTVNVDTKWGGVKGFFSQVGLFLLKCSGEGDLFISCYGGLHEVDVQGSYVVDTGHIAAFESSLSYSVRSVSGLKSLFFSGEGLVAEFSGHGKLFIQTRNPSSLASFLQPFRRVEKSNNN